MRSSCARLRSLVPNMTRQTLFIADLHLSAERPDITQCFREFIENIDSNTDALYVLGDLFEVWIGDDDVNPFTNEIAALFASLEKKQIPVYFIHGNRDFLLRHRYATRANFTILPQDTVVDLYGTRTLIMHGDQLCTQDIAYQKFRKKSRSWWWPRLVLSLPLFIRKKLAQKGREVSKENQRHLTQMIMDVTPTEVTKVMEDNDVCYLVHGHTHRPHKHHIELKNGAGQRIVLGDWYEQGSYLKVTHNDWDLVSLPFRSI